MTDNPGGFVVLTGHGDAAHPELEHWHGNIGQPVALDLGAPLSWETDVFDVVSWNVAIGLGRIEELVEKIRAGAFDGEKRSIERPLIVLAQEAYRADETIPEIATSVHHGGKHPRTIRKDVVDIARSLGFSLRYAPSMRNGGHRSDRGNAVLSSVQIKDARAFPLVHVRQRRIAVAVELEALPWVTFTSAHLDTRGRVRDSPITGRYSSGRSAQAAGLARRLVDDWGNDQTFVVGADLNSYFATREPLMRGLQSEGFVRVPHEPRRTHTFHAPGLRMLLDHILVRTPATLIRSVTVRRLDETPRDAGRYVFGSDHHPLLARIEIARPDRRFRQRG